MLAPCMAEVASRIIVVDGDVRDQPRACIVPLDEIVGEQRVFWKTAARRMFEYVNVVDALAREAPFAVQVLIHIGHRRGVGIDTWVSRVDGRKWRVVRARQRHANPRLENSVAAADAPAHRVPHRAIQWMRDRADEQRCRAGRQHGVRVERDDVAHLAERRRVADNGGERVGGAGQHEAVELPELAALALPSHPRTLLWIPASGAVEQKERVAPRGCTIPTRSSV